MLPLFLSAGNRPIDLRKKALLRRRFDVLKAVRPPRHQGEQEQSRHDNCSHNLRGRPHTAVATPQRRPKPHNDRHATTFAIEGSHFVYPIILRANKNLPPEADDCVAAVALWNGQNNFLIFQAGSETYAFSIARAPAGGGHHTWISVTRRMRLGPRDGSVPQSRQRGLRRKDGNRIKYAANGGHLDITVQPENFY